ncbi:MAG: NAD(P)-dependent oxidoreductase [Burkholderiaceae bacterium]|nr:MAG: NAD(P)-dependent oxidoreductase [Burkholderiaceae bacterium]
MDKIYSATPPQRVAFIGLGTMGFPMAGHLQRAGHAVTVFNRSANKAARWTDVFGGAAKPTPAAAARDAQIVFSCVGNDADVRSITLGEHGAFAAMPPGAIFVDHTTTSATMARELYAAAQERGLHFVDAPVSGGQAGAENGTLTIMCGGSAAAIEAMTPVALAYAQAVTRIGDAGSGQLAKMVNQIAIAGLLQGLAEALHFGQQAGLDMPRVLEVIGKGAARSWQMENRGPTMLKGEFDFGFAVDWMRKDLGLVLEQARTLGATLPVTALVDQFYADVQAMGGQRWDTSSLITRLVKHGR